MTDHLVLFVKAPRMGSVKSRLAGQVGWTAATGFYRWATRRAIDRLGRDRRWRIWLAVTPDRDRAARFWPHHLPRIAQGGGDLGQRMQRPMDRLPPGPVVIVGTDIPDIRPAHVAAAFRALRRCDVVFGPARDGGYWLVGQRRRPRVHRLFDGVRWSTEHALRDTVDNVPVGARIALLDTLDDVDDAEALSRVRRR